MEPTPQSIESIRNKFEPLLLSIEGITGVGIGLCQSGNPCLKIYTSVPARDIRQKLPSELKTIEFEIEDIGEVRTQ